MFHDDLIGWTTMSRIQAIPYTIPFVNRYVTCPRFDRRYPNTLFNLVTGKSLYSYRNAWSRDQPLGHFELIMMMHYRVGPEIPLRHTEWQIPVLIRVNPTDTFGDTRSIPLWSPSYVVTFGTPKALLRYPGVTRSHGLRKGYLTLENSSKRTIRSCAMFRIGSCPSHHSPNDVISLSMTSNVHSQETMTICWSTS